MSLHEELSAPFPVGELKFYPVAIKDGRGKVGSYIDARAVMDRLDAAASVGPGNWSTAYRCIDPMEKAVECTLSIRIDGEWVSRSDVGYPNEAKDADNPDKEPWKAAYSDSLKRAAVQWGVGRYIYSLALEKDWLPVDQFKKFTEQPRLKGQPQQSQQPTRTVPPLSAAAPPEPAHVTVATPAKGETAPAKKPNLYEVAAQMGFSRDQVIAVCQKHFENREPHQIGKPNLQRLLVLLEEDKKKASAA